MCWAVWGRHLVVGRDGSWACPSRPSVSSCLCGCLATAAPSPWPLLRSPAPLPSAPRPTRHSRRGRWLLPLKALVVPQATWRAILARPRPPHPHRAPCDVVHLRSVPSLWLSIWPATLLGRGCLSLSHVRFPCRCWPRKASRPLPVPLCYPLLLRVSALRLCPTVPRWLLPWPALASGGRWT